MLCTFGLVGTHLFTDGRLWEAIDDASSDCADGQRRVAVAYVGLHRPRLGLGDTLVANTSDASMRQGSTSKGALHSFAAAGAQVFGVGRLHAKVMVFGKWAIVGSSNLSTRASQAISIEAAVVSDSSVLVREANAFIDGLVDGLQPLTDDEIASLPEFEPTRRVAPEAVDPPKRLWVYWPDEHEFVEEELSLASEARRGLGRGRHANIATDPDDGGLVGDWLLHIERDGNDSIVFEAPLEIVGRAASDAHAVLIVRHSDAYEDLNAGPGYERKRSALGTAIRDLRPTDDPLCLSGDEAARVVDLFRRGAEDNGRYG